MSSEINSEYVKEKLLEKIFEYHKQMNSAENILDHDFNIIDQWFVKNLPMLKNGYGSHLVDLLRNLQTDGYVIINQKKLTFKVTQKALDSVNSSSSNFIDESTGEKQFHETRKGVLLYGLLISLIFYFIQNGFLDPLFNWPSK